MSERTKKIEAIFHAASERSTPEERESFLNEACLGDENLRREVDELLKAALAGEELFRDCSESSRGAPVETLAEQPGTVIGRYKLLEKVGEGGMGVVYMAEQEQPVRRKVALKIIKLGMDTRQVVARFEAERQALALMDHPNIAQVLDAGATETGRPYFVMELVQGVPITEFCESNPLSIRQRLQLFIPVCQAIQSAHQKGIIHRDLKPSNVMVTMHNGAPHPMVIDFGVAKATGQKLTEKTLFTNFATMIGTPAYMSPEQAEMSKLDVDTRSDIYSLGVLLYELLTGTTPFPEERLRSVAYGEMQRIIAEEEPERPSTRLRKKATTGSAKPLVTDHSPLATDLDWIVMKCLEKDRTRRYETAAGLAADLQAHLNNEPVAARPPTVGYRLQKFVRRNRTISIAAALVASAILAGLVISFWALARERAARQHADGRLRAALAFIDEVFNIVEPAIGDLPGAASAQEKLGRAGLEFLGQLQSNAANNPGLQLALARVFVKMSIAQNPGNGNSGGNFEAGLQQATQAVALLSNRSLPVTESERIYLQALASFNRLQCLYALGRVDEAINAIPETDSYHIQLERFPEKARSARRDRQSLRSAAGYGLTLAGRPSEALERFLLPLLKSDWVMLVKSNYAQAEGYERETLMNVNGNIANAYFFLQKPMAMRSYIDEALRIADSLAQQFPNNSTYARGRVAYTTLAGYALVRTANVERGTQLLNESRMRIDALASNDPANDQFRSHRAVTAAIQAMAFASLSSAPSANATERRAHLSKAEAYLGEAEEFTSAAKNKEPEAYLKAARSELREILETTPLEFTSDFEMLLRATATTKGWSAAAEVCRKHFDGFPDSLWLWLNKAWVFRYAGDEESFGRVVEKVLTFPAAMISTNDQHVPIEIAALGSFPFSSEQLKQLDAMISALEIALPGRSTDQRAWGYRAIGQMQLRFGRFDQCLAALEKSASNQTSPEAYNLFIKAMCLRQLSRADEARAAFDQAEGILKTGSLNQPEGFLRTWEIYQQLLMRREARALLGLK